jgi:hypothetical protein
LEELDNSQKTRIIVDSTGFCQFLRGFDNSKTGNNFGIEGVLTFFMVFGGARYPSKNENNCILYMFLTVFDGF